MTATPENFSARGRGSRRWAMLAIRILFGAFFMVSGALKAVDPGAFLLDVRSFQVLPDPWAAVLALGLPWLEIFCGIAVAVGRWVEGALALLVGGLVVFVGALVQAWVRGIDVTCGCFGHSENRTNFPRQIAFDVALVAIGLVLYRWHGRGAGCPAADRPPPVAAEPQP